MMIVATDLLPVFISFLSNRHMWKLSFEMNIFYKPLQDTHFILLTLEKVY